jgi:CheY-like chemotaxis protein
VVRLSQVLANLLNNAAKYTDAGGEIAILARAVGNSAEITVRDNGSGISAEALPHIFEMFSRGDRSSANRATMIVALTGWGQDEDRRRALSAGFDRHLIKPADIGALQALFGSVGPADASRSPARAS